MVTNLETTSVAFLPYRISAGEISIFLQKRTSDAPTFSGKFLTFGGGVEEGEDHYSTLLRELREELAYTPTDARYLDSLYFPHHTVHIYAEQVLADFEQHIHVMEGEYGVFLTESELFSHPDVPGIVKELIPGILEKIHTL